MPKYLIFILSILACIQLAAMDGNNQSLRFRGRGTSLDNQPHRNQNTIRCENENDDEEECLQIVPGSFAILPNDIVKLLIFNYFGTSEKKSVAQTCSKYWIFVDKTIASRPLAKAFFAEWSKKSKTELLAFDPRDIDEDTVAACRKFYPLWVKNWKVEGAGSADGYFYTDEEENLKKHFVACQLLGDDAAKSKKQLEKSINHERFAFFCYCKPSCCNGVGTIVGTIAGTWAGLSVGGLMLAADKDLIGIAGSACVSGYTVFRLIRGYFRNAAFFSEDALNCEDVEEFFKIINTKH